MEKPSFLPLPLLLLPLPPPPESGEKCNADWPGSRKEDEASKLKNEEVEEERRESSSTGFYFPSFQPSFPFVTSPPPPPTLQQYSRTSIKLPYSQTMLHIDTMMKFEFFTSATIFLLLSTDLLQYIRVLLYPLHVFWCTSLPPLSHPLLEAEQRFQGGRGEAIKIFSPKCMHVS